MSAESAEEGETMLVDLLKSLNWFILCYLIVISFGYIILLIASVRDVFLRFQEIRLGDVLSMMKSEMMPSVTVLIAAYNEEKNVTESVYSALKSTYTNTFVTVINDGSTDNTLKVLMDTFALEQQPMTIPQLIKDTGKLKTYYVSKTYPNLVVIDKEHVDKSDSLNVGVNACRTPLFMTVDADTLLEPDAVSEVVFYMLTKPHAVAVGGAAYIINSCKYKDGVMLETKMPYKLIPALQACEYLRSFVINRAGWNYLGGSLSFSGAFTLFEHKAVVDIGGFDVGNPANDFEIITHLHAYKLKTDAPYQIGFTPAATAWTDVPATLKEYWHQRTNWQKGTLRSLLLHKQMFFNPRYRLVGLFGYPFFLLAETFGALVECTAYLTVILSWALGIIHWYTAVLFFIVCWLFVTSLTMATGFISFLTYDKYHRLRDLPWLLFVVTLESFGFRQFHMICRVLATFRYFIFGDGKKKK